MESAINYLIGRAQGSPNVLLDALELLGEQDAEARALLYRAAEIANTRAEPEQPRP